LNIEKGGGGLGRLYKDASTCELGVQFVNAVLDGDARRYTFSFFNTLRRRTLPADPKPIAEELLLRFMPLLDRLWTASQVDEEANRQTSLNEIHDRVWDLARSATHKHYAVHLWNAIASNLAQESILPLQALVLLRPFVDELASVADREMLTALVFAQQSPIPPDLAARESGLRSALLSLGQYVAQRKDLRALANDHVGILELPRCIHDKIALLGHMQRLLLPY